jgi:hypothetical protein
MTQTELIEMAIQAGLNFYVNDLTEKKYIEVIKHFAKLVAEHEREACANICEEMAVKDNLTNYYKVAANAIRARGQGGHAFYCVACAKKLFGGYKESESFDRTASHMANEYVEYKEPILTDAEISESYYEVFKTAMIDIKAFEFAYSLLRKAQEK